jgi:hypothetical protein
MEEQNESKKRAGTGFSGEFRRVKIQTSRPIPDVVRDSNGDMYIVREFKEEMRGKKIPDDMVVKAANGRWFTKQEVTDFVLKSTPRCPTYGVCSHCFSSGPVHMLCQKCKTEGHRYFIPRIGEGCGKFLDAEWMSRFFGTTHVDMRADKTQRWYTQQIWNMRRNSVKAYIDYVWPAGKLLREDERRGVLETFMDGTEVEDPGEWDANENPVEYLRWDDPDMYRGKDDDDKYA